MTLIMKIQLNSGKTTVEPLKSNVLEDLIMAGSTNVGKDLSFGEHLNHKEFTQALTKLTSLV
jgi:hypothetical protein